MTDLLPMAFRSLVGAIVDRPQTLHLLNAEFASRSASVVSFSDNSSDAKNAEVVIELHSLPYTVAGWQPVVVRRGDQDVIVESPVDLNELLQKIYPDFAAHSRAVAMSHRTAGDASAQVRTSTTGA
jgi:hypothetical protein